LLARRWSRWLDVVTAGQHDFGALELDAPKATVDGVLVEIVFVRVVVVESWP